MNGSGKTEKLSPEMNVSNQDLNTDQKTGENKSKGKSESTWHLIRRSVFGGHKRDENNEPPVVKHKKGTQSIQNAISYNLMYEDGICELGNGEYSVTFGFDDINYQTANKDDQLSIFQHYCELLEYYGPDTSIQVSIINRYVNADAFKRTMLLKPTSDGFDNLRKERNNIMMQASSNSNNNLISSKYLTVTQKADDYEKASANLSRVIADTIQNFKNMGCHAAELSGYERCRSIYEFFHPYESFDFKYSHLLNSNLTTKDYVIPNSLEFTKKSFVCGNSVGAVLYIKDFPNSITDKYVEDLSDINCQMAINLHLQSVDKAQALDIVDSQLSKMETRVLEIQRKAAKYNDVPLIPREVQYSIDEAEELREAINSAGMKMFVSTVIITVMADNEDALADNIERVKGVSRQHGCEVTEITYLQREGLNTSLPIGANELKPFVTRTLTSASAGMFIPFTTQELFQRGGIYYGINQVSGNIISFDRKTLKNPNGVVLGTPGSGKSFTSKREILDVFLSTNDSIIILDPEREYSPLVKMLNGQNVFLSLASNNYINPFDINENYADSENPVSLKSDFIISMVQLIAGGKQGLSNMTLSIIDRCVNLTYLPYFSDNSKKAKMPTFPDFWNILKQQPEIEAQQIAVALERYVTGNLNLFSHESNVNLNNRVICFDVRDLGKQMKTLGMLICTDFIWNKITENREKGIRTWLYFDEFYLFFKDDYSAEFFFELWKRARKWGAIPTGITQNVEDLLLSDTARRILSNTEFALLLNQSTSDREEIAHIFNLAPRQLQKITNSNEGEGIIVAGKSILAFKDKFPKDTSIYSVLTTKPDEVKIN